VTPLHALTNADLHCRTVGPQAAPLRVLATPRGGWHGLGRPCAVPWVAVP
jgi:hypothetical protein